MPITNPRFINYARVHGRSPQDQLEHDRKEYPGGSMCGYLLWNNARIQEFYKAQPTAFFCGRISDYAAYDEWLNQYPAA